MRLVFLLMFITISPITILMAEGSSEPDREENNATLEEIMRIFDENYQFIVFETIKEEYDEGSFGYYEENGIYELYINNDFIFSGNFMLLCGGEVNRLFDFKHYNFVVRVPRDIFMNFHKGMKISKQTLMELLIYPYYMAEAMELNIDNFDIEQFLEILNGQGDADNFGKINRDYIKKYINNSMASMYEKTLKEKNANGFTNILLFMMLLNGM
jgi:hypothetical protein